VKEALTLSRLKPNRLLGQILIVIFGAVLLYQLAAVIVFRTFDLEGKRQYVSEADFVTGIFISLNGVSNTSRTEQAREIMAATPYVRIDLTERVPERFMSNDPVLNAEIARINEHWKGAAAAFPTLRLDETGGQAIAAQLAGGTYSVISIIQEKKPAQFLWRWITDSEPAIPLFLTRLPRALLLYFITVCVILYWVAKEIVAPIIKLSKEVKAVSLDGDYSLRIHEQGSEEIIDLTRSINEMHRKIFDMALHRRYALAGLSHDLKTILTRLNLRVEFVDDCVIQEKFKQDFGLMGMMVERNLEFLRAEGTKSDYIVVDLESLIDTVLDQFHTCDATITFSGAGGVSVENSVSDLFRILTNVISNAVEYSGNVNIVVSSNDDDVFIEVSDDGPGIPEELKVAVLEPFVRGDPQQTLRDGGGFGLGLSIVKTLLNRQGGKIKLIDNSPRGLIVQLVVRRRLPQN
jgi:signal transduction histidine kinase